MASTRQGFTNDAVGLDTSILSNVTLEKNTPVRSGFATASTKCTGTAKASNLFYKILFTKRGSNILDPGEGTDLVDLIGSNTTETDLLYLEVKTAVEEAVQQVRQIQINGVFSADEQLTGGEIVQFAVNPETAALGFKVQLRVATGDAVIFQLPSLVLS